MGGEEAMVVGVNNNNGSAGRENGVAETAKMKEMMRGSGVEAKSKVGSELIAGGGWYLYASDEWPGEAHMYKIDKILFDGRSKQDQHMLVFETSGCGKIVILDGALQLTDRDECSYQEMMTHLPLCSIPNPKKLLVIGGGDGGLLREASRHSSLEQIDICELDEMIIQVYEKFFPDIAIGYKDPRVKLHIGDGIAFTKSVPQGTYDAIIVDAFCTMGGPGGSVYLSDMDNGMSLLEAAAKALRPGGVLCVPAEGYWLKDLNIKQVYNDCRKHFKGSVCYAWISVPCYESGIVGFMLCSTEGPNVDFKNPINPLQEQHYSSFGVATAPLKFYNSEMHRAAFCLPAFMKTAIGNLSTACYAEPPSISK